MMTEQDLVCYTEQDLVCYGIFISQQSSLHDVVLFKEFFEYALTALIIRKSTIYHTPSFALLINTILLYDANINTVDPILST